MVTATKVGNNDSGRNPNRAAAQKKTDKPKTVLAIHPPCEAAAA
jgi:hypothetical protein